MQVSRRGSVWAAVLCLLLAGIAATAKPADAASVNTIYDMRGMLSQPHPFASAMGTRWKPAQPGIPFAPAIARPVAAPVMRQAPGAAPPPPMPMESAARDYPTGLNWISEIRLGALAHSAPISTGTPKETGVDANIEVLFHELKFFEPENKFLRLLVQPRPHIGGSFNGSNLNTDMGYAGVTWEWMPWKWMFIDFSFGFAVHNGRLKANPNSPDQGRRREFGCRWLFRESLEVGFVFFERHSLSGMWDHVSHGGVCDSENEGMDNAGVRYGYRF